MESLLKVGEVLRGAQGPVGNLLKAPVAAFLVCRAQSQTDLKPVLEIQGPIEAGSRTRRLEEGEGIGLVVDEVESCAHDSGKSGLTDRVVGGHEGVDGAVQQVLEIAAPFACFASEILSADVFGLTFHPCMVVAVKRDEDPPCGDLFSKERDHFTVVAQRMGFIETRKRLGHAMAGFVRDPEGRNRKPDGDFIPDPAVACLDFLGTGQRAGIVVSDQELQAYLGAQV